MTDQTTVLGIFGTLGIVLSLPAWWMFLRACWRLYSTIAAGQPSPGRTTRPVRRGLQTLKEALLHTELMRKPAVAVAHWFVMLGFLLGVVVWFEAYIQTFRPDSGWPLLKNWAVYHFAEEVLALGTALGILFLIAVRLASGGRDRVSRFYGSNARAAYFVEAVVFFEAVGMLLVKAGKIATYGHGSYVTDFFTIHLASLLPASPVMVSAFALFKLLTGMIWLAVVAHRITWGVAWHRILAFFNLFFQRNPTGEKALGKLTPMVSKGRELTLDTVEDDDVLGVGTREDAPWKMLLDVSTCTECGRCQEQCPAWHTEKPLSPKLLVTDLRDVLLDPEGTKLVTNEDALWSCTNCGACVEQCPVDIEHIDHVANLRRYQVLSESEFPGELGGLFKNLEVKGNPWGRNASERSSWIEEARRDGIDVPEVGDGDFEYLFWVGCAGAFDDAGRRTSRAVVELLRTAGVKFAVLNKAETCTGDPARRAGNEFLFQMLASQNIETLDDAFSNHPVGQRKIITTCPHCFNTLRNEYPDFDGHYDVFHHTQLLNRLVRDGLLTPVPRGPENRKPITYHDPCFLGRHNKVFDPPRELIEAAAGPGALVEMPRNRNEGFCCGAGGARMFMEEKLGTRINENRAAEAVATDAAEIAVGCPFCNTMMAGGVKAVATESAPAVKDVAQMLRDSILVDGALPTPRKPDYLDTPVRNEALPKPGVSTSTSTKPSAASEPAAQRPSAPATAAPSVPAVPAVPTAPAAPAAPAVPVPPAAPAAPVAPVPPAPAAPSVSVPAAPSATVPSAPAAPAVPVPPAPGAPVTPVPPAAPAAPAAPVPPAPAAPSVSVPPAPSAPSPSVPAAPSAPVPPAPSAPSVAVPPAPTASTPAAPSVPVPPAAPAAPAVPVPPAPAAPSFPVPPAPSAPPAAAIPVPPKPDEGTAANASSEEEINGDSLEPTDDSEQ